MYARCISKLASKRKLLTAKKPPEAKILCISEKQTFICVCSDYRDSFAEKTLRQVSSMDSSGYTIDYSSIEEAPELEDRPVRRSYPAFIEDKTFLPTFTLSTKTRVLDLDEDYTELTLGDQISERPPLNGDGDDSERWHVCHKCNKVFGTAKELRRHLPRHKISKKVYECEICYRTFTQSNHLKQHMPVHSGNISCSKIKNRY